MPVGSDAVHVVVPVDDRPTVHNVAEPTVIATCPPIAGAPSGKVTTAVKVVVAPAVPDAGEATMVVVVGVFVTWTVTVVEVGSVVAVPEKAT